jgi:hypothetical protein
MTGIFTFAIWRSKNDGLVRECDGQEGGSGCMEMLGRLGAKTLSCAKKHKKCRKSSLGTSQHVREEKGEKEEGTYLFAEREFTPDLRPPIRDQR